MAAAVKAIRAKKLASAEASNEAADAALASGKVKMDFGGGMSGPPAGESL